MSIEPRSENISVVVQGPVVGGPGDSPAERFTERALTSVRRHLPHAEIVLSTWAGSDVRGLSFDLLVTSDDPGTMRCDTMTRDGVASYYNANRQIRSTYNGLRAASRPLAMKLRSDMVLAGTGFLRYFGTYPVRADRWRIVGERVVTADFFSRSLNRREPFPFHPSDWFHFGRREDVQAIWNIPFAERDMVRWYESHERPRGDRDWWLTQRYTVEQHNWLSFLAQHPEHGRVDLRHKSDVSGPNREQSELSIANNLVIAGVDELSIEFFKYPIQAASAASLYTHGEWQRLYRDYCDPTFRPRRDARLWRRRAYDRVVAPAHHLLESPRSWVLARAISGAWERTHPPTFRAAKRLYLAGLSMLGRRPR